MIKTIFNFLMISGVILGFIFIVATQFSKKGKDKSIVYLNLLVLFLTLNNLQICLIDNIFTNANYFIRNLLLPFYVLIIPSFYSFLIYYLKIEQKIKSYIVFTGSLFMVEIIVRIILYHDYYHEINNYVVAKYSQVEEIFNALFTLFLFGKAFVILFRYSKLYQYVLSFDNIKWLKNFMFLGSIILLTWVCAIILNLDKVINPQIFIYYPLRLTSSVLLYWIGYQGFFNYSLMAERIKLRQAIKNNDSSEDNNHEILPLETKNHEENKFLEIKRHIENNNRFLDPLFSLEILADETKISVGKLSQIIQKQANYNFTDYINKLRVEKAKEILIAPEYEDYTIVSIGLECGFYSKSTFYRAFAKFTNTTPTNYKEENS
jgi:AraC-like DNA-binding protein